MSAELPYDRMAAELVARRLGPLAILALEAGKPLSFVGSQLLICMDPILKLFGTIPYYQEVVSLLEDRERIERLILALEQAEEKHA